MAIFPWVSEQAVKEKRHQKQCMESALIPLLLFHFNRYPLISIAYFFYISKLYQSLLEVFLKQQMACRYTVGEGIAYGSLPDLGKVASTYAPYFGALVLLRLCRAGACP